MGSVIIGIIAWSKFPTKALQKQCETVLPTTKQQLVQYGAQAPDNLPADLPPEEADSQPGGGVKQRG
ncbi:hypothetical protein DSO57_1025597 [Entomophthora muscae]|uniref:Uncharacterized protein n=1 Tax=Entomophthora muscae TaxID=34485 RepID=A0ACC2U0N8_9FUNG|nr:hypothetical protein DSO57_1025597 [Entomophthora muscae]